MKSKYAAYLLNCGYCFEVGSPGECISKREQTDSVLHLKQAYV